MRFLRHRRPSTLAVVVLCLVLQACAARKGLELPDIDDWESRQAVLGDLREWQFKGRIAVKAADEGFNGKLNYLQDDDVFDATLSGPLGIGTMKIAGNEQQVRLTDKDGVVTHLQDAESDLRALYGWTIPVASLRFWALGIPDPSMTAETGFDDSGQLAMIEQGGWIVSIDRYRNAGSQRMPQKITAVNGDARVRLVIDSWAFYRL